MTDREDLIRVVKKLAVACGHMILVSGKEADYHVDIRCVTLDGMISPLVRRVMSELMADLDFDVAGGLILGADPMATAILHARAATGGRLDAFVIHEEAKSHSLQRRVEGTDVAGRRMFMMEDTSVTGGSALTAVEAVCRAGGEVAAVTVAADRITGAAERVTEADLKYRYAIGSEELGF